MFTIYVKQAGAELGQAQLKFGLDFTLISVDSVSLDLVKQDWFVGFSFSGLIELIWFGMFAR